MSHAQSPIAKTAAVGVAPVSGRARLLAISVAAMLGLGLLAVTGFAQSAHDVAHDARHAFSFPCH